MNKKNYWLMKSEASCYSIDDLHHDKKTAWTGVRNYQARNFMRTMQLGDEVLFYHSNGTPTEPTGVYGIARVSARAHHDETQFDPSDDHYDPKATQDYPIWECVDIQFLKKFHHPVTLSEIKFEPKLAGMMVTQIGSRLSVQPVSEKHFKEIIKMSEEK
jgi:predicted RNA-binding protein with PUA-like domain